MSTEIPANLSGSTRHIALFQNVRQVVKIDEAARQRGIATRIVPVPERFSTECGMCIELTQNNYTPFIKLAADLGFNPEIHDF